MTVNLNTVARLSEAIRDLAKPDVETGMRLFEGLFGQPCRIAGEMLGDQLYAWQWKNRSKNAEKVSKIMEEDQVGQRVLPTGFSLELFDAAGNVEDQNLQDLWANLLASAVADEDKAHPMLVNRLRQLAPAGARMLFSMSQLRREDKETSCRFPVSRASCLRVWVWY